MTLPSYVLAAQERLLASCEVHTHRAAANPVMVAAQKAKKSEDNRRYKEKKLGLVKTKPIHRSHNSIAVVIDGVTYPSYLAAKKALKIGANTLAYMLDRGEARHA